MWKKVDKNLLLYCCCWLFKIFYLLSSVAKAVLQTPLWKYVNCISQEPEILGKGSPPPHVMCHASHVTCQVSCVICHVSHVTCHLSLFSFLQSGEATGCPKTCPLFSQVDWRTDALTKLSLHSNRKLADFLKLIHALDSTTQKYLTQERRILISMQLAASLVQQVHWRNTYQPL